MVESSFPALKDMLRYTKKQAESIPKGHTAVIRLPRSHVYKP